MEVSGQFYAPAISPRENRPPYPLNSSLSVPHSHSGCGGEEKNPCPRRESNPARPARIPVTILVAQNLRNPVFVFSKVVCKPSNWALTPTNLRYYNN